MNATAEQVKIREFIVAQYAEYVKNGWDTFERFSAEHPLVPVIIVTARPNQMFTAIGAGVGALLEKPMDIDTLLLTIKRLLAESANQRLARLAGHATEFYYAAAQRAWPGFPENEQSSVDGFRSDGEKR